MAFAHCFTIVDRMLSNTGDFPKRKLYSLFINNSGVSWIYPSFSTIKRVHKCSVAAESSFSWPVKSALKIFAITRVVRFFLFNPLRVQIPSFFGLHLIMSLRRCLESAYVLSASQAYRNPYLCGVQCCIRFWMSCKSFKLNSSERLSTCSAASILCLA